MDDLDFGKNGMQDRRFRRRPRQIVFDIVQGLHYATGIRLYENREGTAAPEGRKHHIRSVRGTISRLLRFCRKPDAAWTIANGGTIREQRPA